MNSYNGCKLHEISRPCPFRSKLHETFIGGTCDTVSYIGLCYPYNGYQGMRNPPTSGWTQELLEFNSKTHGLRVKGF